MPRAFAGAVLLLTMWGAVPDARPVPAQEQPPAPVAPGTEPTVDQIEQFLAEARITDAKPIGKGVTKPMAAHVDRRHADPRRGVPVDRPRARERALQSGRQEKLFRDYYGYNIAAYRLARLLGYDDLVPVSVEREWRGSKGALTWWVDKKWDEDERLKAGIEPPDRDMWERQVYLARVFTALVEDTDRNLGNQLVTEDFHLWMIDFTRAFRLSSRLDKPDYLRKIDRTLFERLKADPPGDRRRGQAVFECRRNARAARAARGAGRALHPDCCRTRRQVRLLLTPPHRSTPDGAVGLRHT